MNFRFPGLVPTSISSVVPCACEEGLQLMSALLHWDPHSRLTASQVSPVVVELCSMLLYSSGPTRACPIGTSKLATTLHVNLHLYPLLHFKYVHHRVLYSHCLLSLCPTAKYLPILKKINTNQKHLQWWLQLLIGEMKSCAPSLKLMKTFLLY